jgi:hypothetical protein
MKWSGRALVATSALGAAWLCWGAIAFAQDDAPEGSTDLDAVVNERAGGNEAAAASQKRIDAISDETDDLLSQFRTVLKQIDSIDLYNTQMRDLIGAQEAEIASLAEQVGRVQEVGRSVTPLMLRMVDAVEKFVDLDVPFLIKERKQRVADLRTMMSRADVTIPEKFRQIMEAYQIENEFGRTIEAYRGTLDVDGKETTVDFLRFGRIALVYQSLDESVSGRWDQDSRTWVSLDSSYRSSIRSGLRIARKQAAPDLIRLPLAAATDARGES